MEPERRNEKKYPKLYAPVPTEPIDKKGSNEKNGCGDMMNLPVAINRGPMLGKRHIQVFSCFLFILFENCEKVSMATALVAMTDPRSTENPNIPTYEWTNKGVILSSFLWCHIVAEPLSGWLTNRYHPKWFLVGSMAISSLVGTCIPTLAWHFGSGGVIAARTVQGLSQTCMFPCVHGLLAKWAPRSERARFVAFAKSGVPAGIIISLFLSSYIASSWYGWPMVFYTFSAIGFSWCLFYAYCGSNGPEYHSTITEEEKLFINSDSKHATLHETNLSIPWVKIFTSSAVWAIFASQCGYYMGFRILQAKLPAYMVHCMKFNLRANGLLSSFPHLTKLIFLFVFAYIFEVLERKKICSTTILAKIFSSMGLLIPAFVLICLGSCGPEDAILVETLLVIGVTATSAWICGIYVNYLDVAPNFTSLLGGIVNGCANVVSILALLLIQFVVTDEKDPSQWKIVFYYTAGISIVASIIYIIFGSGEVQSWNTRETTEEEQQFRA